MSQHPTSTQQAHLGLDATTEYGRLHGAEMLGHIGAQRDSTIETPNAPRLPVQPWQHGSRIQLGQTTEYEWPILDRAPMSKEERTRLLLVGLREMLPQHEVGDMFTAWELWSPFFRRGIIRAVLKESIANLNDEGQFVLESNGQKTHHFRYILAGKAESPLLER